MTDDDQDVLLDSSNTEAPENNLKPGQKEQKQRRDGSGEVEGRYKLDPLTLTVFKRETDSGVFRNYQLQRSYTEDDGDSFDYTSSLRPRDLRKAARLLEKAADDVDGLRAES